MDSQTFWQLLPKSIRGGLNEQTLTLWEIIYAYIGKNGYADAVDNESFIQHVQNIKFMTRGAVQAHLRRMAKAGLIEGHEMRVRQIKKTPFASMFGPIFGEGHRPRKFLRYTLPGGTPSLKVEENARREARNKARDEEAAKGREEGPDSIEMEFEIDDLERWLEDKNEAKFKVQGAKLRKMRKLVDKACSMLQRRQTRMQRLLGAITARSKLKVP